MQTTMDAEQGKEWIIYCAPLLLNSVSLSLAATLIASEASKDPPSPAERATLVIHAM